MQTVYHYRLCWVDENGVEKPDADGYGKSFGSLIPISIGEYISLRHESRESGKFEVKFICHAQPFSAGDRMEHTLYLAPAHF